MFVSVVRDVKIISNPLTLCLLTAPCYDQSNHTMTHHFLSRLFEDVQKIKIVSCKLLCKRSKGRREGASRWHRCVDKRKYELHLNVLFRFDRQCFAFEARKRHVPIRQMEISSINALADGPKEIVVHTMRRIRSQAYVVMYAMHDGKTRHICHSTFAHL